MSLNDTMIKSIMKYLSLCDSKRDVGHGFWHAQRVRQNAIKLSRGMEVDKDIIEIAALLHDAWDWKFFKNSNHNMRNELKQFLVTLKFNNDTIDSITNIIEGISFKGSAVKEKKLTLEGKIVRDADRLEAIGAIGIARVFVYCGYSNNDIYRNKKPKSRQAKAEYIKNNSSAIEHFYEKLLLLKDRMHTHRAKQEAIRRHKIMVWYLNEFYREVDIIPPKWHKKYLAKH